jgi:dTDP-glucose 4,6-dehydratase/UDP-glucose 4-epimerase
MKILILGSEGFIGSHLVNFMLGKKADVFGCDLFERPRQENYQYFKVSRLSPEWEDMFSENTFDVCVNAAGSGNVPYSMTHPFIDFEANTLDVIRILEAIRRFSKTCRYLHLSSAAVYGNPDSLPINERALTHPMSPYGWHKLMAENICNEYYNLFQVNTAVVRPFSVYGEGLRKQLLWDLCGKLHLGNETQLSGTGNESRDFIHVSDLVRLLDCIIQRSPFAFNVYNAATGTETSIRQIADIYERFFKGGKKITFSGQVRSGDPLNWRADIQKALETGFIPSINLEEGVSKYIAWYRQSAM